ncbi:predicted N-formylglutamate amidohydrolase [Cereibacter ovatus]|uniref:Predicted N-formylglutamate amidohydrolase n=1 Tax=Cereibacter ovatus TaxID=439529 RepID=A0A285CWD3_9RHOB|nr:N-formylglutamate amidohydrolase [Cereibacter ovatus]SNX71273.1 predicted N-formylglutamate amidohydrolase [Cereibacter ovatus]
MTRSVKMPASYPAIVENRGGKGRAILVCEHASKAIPPRWGDLGLTAAQREAHIAWDIGALGLARGLERRLDAVLVHAPVSRLVYDCNRAPDQPGAIAERSEMHQIPGNTALDAAERAERTESVYLPFHEGLHAEITRRIALGLSPVLVTIHSFTPQWHGRPRDLEFGIIHDADDRLARAVLAGVAPTGLRAALNQPYAASDDVTHTLKLHALPYGLPNVMLELRNDLIATPEAQEAMADRLAPALAAALTAGAHEMAG